MNLISLQMAAAKLVQRLGGTWQAHGAMCRCPAHDDHTPSLSVRVGHSSLLFKCFAGCTPPEVLRAIRHLALDVPVERSDRDATSALAPDRTGDIARALWQEARDVASSPGQVYLRNRGIHTLSKSLRWHPRTPLGRGRDVRFRPALLAGVEDRGRIVALQRLFLEADGSNLAQDLLRPKRTLGRPLSGAVRLRAPTHKLGIAEGVESAESASLLLGFPVWAALGSERLHQLNFPAGIEHLVLLPDADGAGRKAEQRARLAYKARRCFVETIWPWWGLNDWNDVLLAARREIGTRAGRPFPGMPALLR